MGATQLQTLALRAQAPASDHRPRPAAASSVRSGLLQRLPGRQQAASSTRPRATQQQQGPGGSNVGTGTAGAKVRPPGYFPDGTYEEPTTTGVFKAS